MIYYHTTTFERREISEEIMQAWQAAGNPKAAQWAVLPDAPVHYTATQHAPEWVNGAWVVSDKTPEEIAAENRKVWSSSAAFWASFSDAEKLGILASDIAGIVLLREELRLWAGEVWSDDPRVQTGLNGLVAVGILTPQRKSKILLK